MDIIFGVFGAQLRKSNDLLHGAKHSPPSLMTGGPEGQNPRFPENYDVGVLSSSFNDICKVNFR